MESAGMCGAFYKIIPVFFPVAKVGLRGWTLQVSIARNGNGILAVEELFIPRACS